MENDGLHRPCQPRRHAGPDYRPLDVLPQDEDALHGRARHDSRCHSHHRLLHPPCQPDELRNHRQTDRRALGIHLRARRHAAPPSGTALRSHRLLHLLPGDGLAIQTRTEETRDQARNRFQHHQAEINHRAGRSLPALSPRFLLRTLPDGDFHLPLLHRVPERKPGEL